MPHQKLHLWQAQTLENPAKRDCCEIFASNALCRNEPERRECCAPNRTPIANIPVDPKPLHACCSVMIPVTANQSRRFSFRKEHHLQTSEGAHETYHKIVCRLTAQYEGQRQKSWLIVRENAPEIAGEGISSQHSTIDEARRTRSAGWSFTTAKSWAYNQKRAKVKGVTFSSTCKAFARLHQG